MSRIVRWDPFRDMVAMRSQMDRVMDDWLKASGTLESGEEVNTMRLALDVSENDENFTVKASIPGINGDDLDISFSENTLTISGESQEETIKENERWHVRERRFGRFSRSITLPVAIDADKIRADFKDGVLILTLPKAEETKPRKISVRTNGRKVVEG